MATAYRNVHEIWDGVTGKHVEGFPSKNNVSLLYQLNDVHCRDREHPQAVTGNARRCRQKGDVPLVLSDFVVALRVHFCHFNAFRMPMLFFAPWETWPSHFHFRFLSHILLFYNVQHISDLRETSTRHRFTIWGTPMWFYMRFISAI